MRLAAMGSRDRPTAARSPWQNGHAERLIGSIRRECLDHIVVFGEGHLRRILRAYADYYNSVRTHLALAKDAPLVRPVQRFGDISVRPFLGGLPDVVFGRDRGLCLCTSGLGQALRPLARKLLQRPALGGVEPPKAF